MLIALANLLFFIRGSVRGVDSSRQLAAGIVLGMMIGLIPKTSLLVVLLAIVLILSRANLITGILSAIVFSWVGLLLDPITHSIGAMLLTHESMQAFFRDLHQYPLVAWTRIENTVVTGSLIAGILLVLPVYHISYRVFAGYRDSMIEYLTQNRISKWILSTPPSDLQES